MSDTPLLSLKSFSHSRIQLTVKKPLNIDFFKGKIYEVRGSNGSGKSTFLKCLSGLLPPEQGDIIPQNDLSFSYLGHKNALKDHLDVSYYQGTFFDIKNLWNKKIGDLSQGQKRQIALNRLIASQSVLWIVDEPFANLDQEKIKDLMQECKAHTERGGCLITALHGTGPLFDNSLIIKF